MSIGRRSGSASTWGTVGDAIQSFRLLFVFAAVAVAAIWVSTAAADIAPAPLGLDVDGKEFVLISNSGWKAKSNSDAFEPAKIAVLIAKPVAGSKSAFYRQQYAYIWARTCTAAAQTVTFRRTFFLPGKPKTLGAELFDTTHQAAPANQAISSAKIYINGKLAFSSPGAYMRFAEAARPQRSYFVFGNNTIDVVVVKRAQTDTQGRCRSIGSAPEPLGVSFYIYGKYEADLWLSADSNTTQEFWRREPVDENLHVPVVVGATPENRGLSGIYKGTLVVNISVQGDLIFENKVNISGQGLRNCVVTAVGSYGARMQCDIFRMPAGAKPRATFRALAKFDYKFNVVSVFTNSDGTSPTFDPRLNTNGWRRFHYFCSKSSTDTRCPP
jgi:hypothetical protein